MRTKTRLTAGLISLALTILSAELLDLMLQGTHGSTFV